MVSGIALGSGYTAMTDITFSDISQWQPDFDAPAYLAAGYTVIICRALSKDDGPDKEMPERRDYIRKHDFDAVGYYNRLNATRDPAEQAREFIDVVGHLESNEFPILDLEDGEGDQIGRANAWFKVVDEWAGFLASLYSGEWFMGENLGGPAQWDPRPVWIANYTDNKKPNAEEEPAGADWWQFSCTHSFPGLPGEVDANIFHGTGQAFLSRVRPTTKEAPVPLKRVWIPSPNYSSRSESGVRLIVLHTAEGARTIESLGSFFQGNVSASSHTGADDKVNTVGEYVKRPNKSWTQSDFNAAAVSIELCGFASWSTDEWMNNHHNMLDNCAKWIAEEAAYFDIPITKLSASQAQGSGRGVCQHVDLGSAGGGHHDCGSGFPMDYVLTLAHGGAASTTEEEEFDMIASAVAADGTLHVWNVGPQRESVYLTFQKPGSTSWHGGAPGKAIADAFKFCDAPKDRKIRGIAAAVADNGSFHFFMTLDNGDVQYRYQKKNSSDWSNLSMFDPWG
jgi:GH25 family lysozyme M1 (1,4-beta-N-acetylmuramidase)